MSNSGGHSPQKTYNRIKELLEKNGYDTSNQEKIGDAVNVSRSSVQRWQNNFPKMDDLIFISQKFGVSLDWLVFGKEDNKKDSPAETAEKPIKGYTLEKDTHEEFAVYDICKAFANLSKICNIRIIPESNHTELNNDSTAYYIGCSPITIKITPKFRAKPIELKSFRTTKREYSLFSVSNFRNIRKCDYVCYFIDNRGLTLVNYLFATYKKFQKTHMHEYDMTECFFSNLGDSYYSRQSLSFNSCNGDIDDLIKNITYFPQKYGVSSERHFTCGYLKGEIISYLIGDIERYLRVHEKESY